MFFSGSAGAAQKEARRQPSARAEGGAAVAAIGARRPRSTGPLPIRPLPAGAAIVASGRSAAAVRDRNRPGAARHTGDQDFRPAEDHLDPKQAVDLSEGRLRLAPLLATFAVVRGRLLPLVERDTA